jgi:ABC-type xylose transport system permease subunit
MAPSAQKSAFAAIKAPVKNDAATTLSFVAWREVLLRDVFPTGANAEADVKAIRATTKRIIVVVFHCVAVTWLLLASWITQAKQDACMQNERQHHHRRY